MKLSEIKENWRFMDSIGYWLEQKDDGSSKTIWPEEVLEIGFQLEQTNTKLLQAVNDKDRELFESQELVTELLEALEYAKELLDYCGWGPKLEVEWTEGEALMQIDEAIRKAKSHADTLKGE